MSVIAESEALDVKIHHVSNLLRFFSNNTYEASDHSNVHAEILQLVELLWSLDYKCMKISNHDGIYCSKYPATLFVPDKHMKTMFIEPELEAFLELYRPLHFHNTKEYTPLGDYPHKKAAQGKRLTAAIAKLYDEELGVSPLWFDFKDEKSLEAKEGLLEKKFEAAQYGRSRKRFVMPTILYRNKYIARSATVPMTEEILLRMGYDTAYSLKQSASYSFSSIAEHFVGSETVNQTEPLDAESSLFSFPKLEDLTKFTKLFTEDEGSELLNKFVSTIEEPMKADQNLLESCKIRNIFDLMVEEGKVKYWMRCSSSEIAEGDAYENFKVNAVPYPCCELFAQLKSLNWQADKLVFDWTAAEVKKELFFENGELNCVQSKWNYKEWPLTHMTRVYLMVMLKSIRDSPASEGILVHCLSGWDRTALFISLLRISLWADGEIHKSLDPMQMLYFTLSWDWMFFGHAFSNRGGKGKQIMYFCFFFLKFIKSENFNTTSASFGTLDDYEGNILQETEEQLPGKRTPKKPTSPESMKDFVNLSASQMPGLSSVETTPENSSRKSDHSNRLLKKNNRYLRITELRSLFQQSYLPVMSENASHCQDRLSFGSFLNILKLY